MTQTFDIDIDIAPGVERSEYGTRAMIHENYRIKPHPCGVYLHPVATDPETGLCSICYWDDDVYQYRKVDLLVNTAYAIFDRPGANKELVLAAYHRVVDWDLFCTTKYLKRLPHVKGHIEFVQQIQPRSIHDLADLLALIRPGKVHLIDAYLSGKKEHVRKNLYVRPPNNKMYFKKSHSYAYAAMIISVFNEMVQNHAFLE